MGAMRRCSKTGCQSEALATLTYNYADSTVVIGPLSRRAEPHTYDLCGEHARRTTAPRGWEVLRLELPERYEPAPAPGQNPAIPASVAGAPAARPEDRTAARDAARPGLRLVHDAEPDVGLPPA